ncbi:SRPBCC family protein [Paracraurococcus lichenis]|uniref:SRPBCC family protein n=1 Tax=Paracraurococcus lichenis TaxID=3064888 RepID=A0ABT9E0P7_9PROT|nr:SRPBCC family protein [Paracraurococcus sp. LOR1-02]MDO9709692.1 SRPBCC family protein [Paracraurococcus sp. LOR1-02]
MGEYTGRIQIARPPAEVFAFLADLRNMPRYLPTVSHVGPQGHHDDHDDVAIEGKAEDRTYRDEGWLKAEPEGRRMRWGSHSLKDYGGTLQVTEASGGAAVEMRLQLTPKPEVAERMQREHGNVDHGMRLAVERTLAAIKACCEGTAVSAAEKDTTRSADDLPDSRPFGSSATLNPDI